MNKFIKSMLTGIVSLGFIFPIASSLSPIQASIHQRNPIFQFLPRRYYYNWYHSYPKEYRGWHRDTPKNIKGRWMTRLERVPYRISRAKYYKIDFYNASLGCNFAPRWYSSHKHFMTEGAYFGYSFPYYRYLRHHKYKIVYINNIRSRTSLRGQLRRSTSWFIIRKYGRNHMSVRTRAGIAGVHNTHRYTPYNHHNRIYTEYFHRA